MLPAQIYGNGGLFQNMIRMAESGRVVIFGDGKNHLPRIHVEDCADAYVLAIEKLPIGKRFIVCDDRPCTVDEFMRYLADVFHAKTILHVPKFVLRLITGKFIYQTLTMNCVVTNRALKDELNWKPVYSTYREGLSSLV